MEDLRGVNDFIEVELRMGKGREDEGLVRMESGSVTREPTYLIVRVTQRKAFVIKFRTLKSIRCKKISLMFLSVLDWVPIEVDEVGKISKG